VSVLGLIDGDSPHASLKHRLDPRAREQTANHASAHTYQAAFCLAAQPRYERRAVLELAHTPGECAGS